MKPGEMWSLGDYAAAGDRWAEVSTGLARAFAAPGISVLDLACGPGALAIAAAAAGAEVTALDAAPALLDRGRRRAEAAGVAVEWIEAEMTAVPVEDASFDVVASAFGCMFAPDPEAMAAELVRLCRPGGRIVALAWTPESAFGAMSPLAGRYLPDSGPSPVERWATAANVAQVFANLPVRLETSVRTVEVVWPGHAEAMREITEGNPAWLMIRSVVEPAGRWDELASDLGALLATHGREESGRFVLPVDYLETTAHRVLSATIAPGCPDAIGVHKDGDRRSVCLGPLDRLADLPGAVVAVEPTGDEGPPAEYEAQVAVIRSVMPVGEERDGDLDDHPSDAGTVGRDHARPLVGGVVEPALVPGRARRGLEAGQNLAHRVVAHWSLKPTVMCRIRCVIECVCAGDRHGLVDGPHGQCPNFRCSGEPDLLSQSGTGFGSHEVQHATLLAGPM